MDKKTIIDSLKKFEYKADCKTVFCDCIEILALDTITKFQHSPEDEKNLKETYEKYSKEDREQINEIVQDIAKYSAQHIFAPNDYLGELYMEVIKEFGTPTKGQYFTPFHVAQLMAKLSTPDCDKDDNAIIKIADICCGSGCLLLAQVEELKSKCKDPIQNILAHAEDIDLTCVYMTYIQLTVTGVPAIVEHKDALKQETFKTLKTPWYYVQQLITQNQGEM